MMNDQNISRKTEERYSIVFRGQILEDFTPEKVRMTLAKLLDKDEERIAHLFDGKSRILKKGLNWERACRYQKALEKAGAASKVQVMMDKISLKNAIVPITDSFSDNVPLPEGSSLPTEEKEQDDAVVEKKSLSNIQSVDVFKFGFERIRFIPAVFCLPHSEPVYSDTGKKVAYISSFKSAVGREAALLAAAGIGLFLEWKLTSLYAKVFTTGFSAILLGVLVLLCCIIFLPNFITPSRLVRVSLNPGKTETVFFCRQLDRIKVLKRSFSVSDTSDVEIARMYRHIFSSAFICENSEGAVMLKGEEEPGVDEIARNAAEVIGDKLIATKVSAVLDMVNQWRGRNKVKKVYVIRDSNGAAIGHFALARFCVLTLYENKVGSIDRRMIYSFSLALAGL